MQPVTPRSRFRFAGFVLSPARRMLLRDGVALPLIPRYFDLLLLLIERRHEAVHRREILERVWSEVVVSDGALSQAIRTLRRTLGDDPRAPVFIRTVSRHGYQFVYPEVTEEADGAPPAPAASDPIEAALERLLAPPGATDDDERREAAEALHLLGTAETLRRLDSRPGHATARALLRDARWAVPGAGEVPLLGLPGSFGSVVALVGMRLRLAARLAGRRWGAASMGGAAAGALAGLLGGLVLRFAPGSDAMPSLPVVFALVGGAVGGIGAAGVGAGLAIAEALARSFRGVALVGFGALGGGAVGLAARLVGGWIVEGLFGRELSAVGGGVEGTWIGAAAGLGYALSTPRPGGGGMATPRGASRAIASVVAGTCCAAACLVLTWTGGKLGGTSLDLLARSFQGSHVGLAPLGRLFGEPGLGPVTRAVLAVYEGFLFGAGLVFGLTRRPKPAP